MRPAARAICSSTPGSHQTWNVSTTTPTSDAGNCSAMSSAWHSVDTTPRSAAKMGCIGSIPRRTPLSLAYGASSAIASTARARAPTMSRSPFGSPPGTSTSVAAPSSAVSSIAVRFDRCAAARSAGSAQVKKPPRQIDDTRRPLSAIQALVATKAWIADSGLRVSSICRGGFFTCADPADRAAAHRSNLTAIDETAELGAATLVLVPGGLPKGDRDIVGARARAVEAIAELAPYASDSGVRLGIEPMHPIFAADRGVVSTLCQALDIAEQFPASEVGVVVDTFHVWWEPGVLEQIARAAGRIVSYQVCEWITPLPADTLLSRGMMGDGHIDFAGLTKAVAAAGYSGDVEVEIFNADVW